MKRLSDAGHIRAAEAIVRSMLRDRPIRRDGFPLALSKDRRGRYSLTRNFAVPWGVPHNADLREVIDWLQAEHAKSEPGPSGIGGTA